MKKLKAFLVLPSAFSFVSSSHLNLEVLHITTGQTFLTSFHFGMLIASKSIFSQTHCSHFTILTTILSYLLTT